MRICREAWEKRMSVETRVKCKYEYVFVWIFKFMNNNNTKEWHKTFLTSTEIQTQTRHIWWVNFTGNKSNIPPNTIHSHLTAIRLSAFFFESIAYVCSMKAHLNGLNRKTIRRCTKQSDARALTNFALPTHSKSLCDCFSAVTAASEFKDDTYNISKFRTRWMIWNSAFVLFVPVHSSITPISHVAPFCVVDKRHGQRWKRHPQQRHRCTDQKLTAAVHVSVLAYLASQTVG